MESELYEKDIHLLVIGANGVGKSTLLRCFCNDSVTTEGEGSGTYLFHFEEQNFRIKVSEKEKWNRDQSAEYDAVAVVFSTTDADSFDYSLDVVKEIRAARYLPIVAIENKIDLLEESVFDKVIVEEDLKKLHLRLYRISSLEEFNVMHPFAYLLEKLMRNCDENDLLWRAFACRRGRDGVLPSKGELRRRNVALCEVFEMNFVPFLYFVKIFKMKFG